VLCPAVECQRVRLAGSLELLLDCVASLGRHEIVKLWTNTLSTQKLAMFGI
jgi:hypothetical protein